jgi:hypothetical protein
MRVAGPVAPPNPARNTAIRDDAADRVRFECAVAAQQAQDFDPGAALGIGSIIGALMGGAAGGSLGALFGLIGDIPGRGAAVGAIVLGGAGMMAGGLIKLAADTSAYERGLSACLAARAATPLPAPSIEPGLVEYRLRILSLRHQAFTSFLSTAELADGAAGPGLEHLADVADAGTLERGAVLVDRHVAPAAEAVARAFGAVPATARVKLGGARRDYWDEARWYGKPGERTVWVVTARTRRPQEVRRIGLSDATALAHYRPLPQPIFGAAPEAAVAIGLSYLLHAQDHGTVGAWADRTLDRSRGIAAIVGVNDDVSADRVYLVVNHAVRAATYEAVLAWSQRGEDRDLPRAR